MIRLKFAPSFVLFALYLLLYCTTHVGSAALNGNATSCHPEEGEFLCKSGHECIHASQVCDKRTDCSDESDEFPDCDNSCSNVTCAQGCTPNIDPNQNGICFCNAGFRISGAKRDRCSNINECQEKWGICSQQCTDTTGSFKCSCIQGFDLLPNNSTCVPKGPIAKIIFALKNSVKVLDPVTSRTTTIAEKMGQTVGVTFDASREYVYWTDVHEKLEAIYRSKLDGKNMKVIVDTGLLLVEGIAFDWIAGNIYFTDSNLTHLGVCDKDGKRCAILVQEKIDKPREIVLHPSKGKLYWTDWGVVPSIVSAGMDGSLPLPIISSDLQWPNGLAIDHGTSRLYWTDAHSDTIETSNLEGGDRRIVRTTGIRHPFSMDIFGDTLYWSDWSLQQIQSCNKFTGEDHRIEFGQHREQINGVAIYHPAAQPKNRVNHCENTRCSHICVLTPTQSYRCLCPVGMILESDKKTCKDDPEKAKLFIAEGSNLNQMHFHSIGRGVLSEKNIEGLHTIGTITYNPLNDTFVLFDTFRKSIFSYDPKAHKLNTLVSRHLDSVKGIDIDAVSQNLFWVDAGKQTVEVQSLLTGARAVILHDVEDRPFDIIAVPEVKSLFVAIVGQRKGQIIRMSMDGLEMDVIVQISDGEPAALTYYHPYDHIFWCDPIKGTIEHVSIDGGARFLAVAKAGVPFSIATYGNRIYWSDRYSQALYSVIIETNHQDSPIYLGKVEDRFNTTGEGTFFATIGIKDRDLRNIEDMIDLHECSPARKNGTVPCSHICLISDDDYKAQCICHEGYELDPKDKSTCVPQAACSISQFKCKDNTCLSMEYRCDNFRDCTHGEDELNCTTSASTCRASDFVCASDQSCISGVWHCDGEKDCHDGSDEKNCPTKPCPNPSDFKCALGRCIPQSWRCDKVIDCPDPDFSDEANCNFTCNKDEFKCGGANGHDCISKEWVCDGEQDCNDGSDEHHTCFTECSKDEFRCMNHHCIRKRFVCNERDDCGDNSDEAQCPLLGSVGGFHSTSSLRGTTIPFNGTTTIAPLQRNSSSKCTSDKYWCLSGECVDFKLVCNGKGDCLDGSDESETCSDTCGLANECSHTCNRTPRGPLCSCPPGYRLSPKDSKSCEDIDECSEQKCDHYCQNLKGGYKCTCHDEYILKSDHKTCKSKGNPPLFIYEWNKKIFVARQDLLSATQVDVPTSVNGLDVDSHNGNMYWTNARRGTVGRVNTDPKVPPEILIRELSTPSHIAYDWISNNAFIVSSSSSGREKQRQVGIRICSLSKNSTKRGCASLYHISGYDVTGIAVAPEENYIFWTEVSFSYYSSSGAITRGKMDGTGTTMLATQKVINPTGIAVDHVFKRVFWIDSKTRTVEVVNFDGKERKTVISSGISRQVSSGLAVFENWVMWSDDGKNIRCRTDMQTECMHVKVQNASDARYLTLLQQSLQPTGKDPCANNSCSFICTSTTPEFTLSSKPIRRPKCLCPQGFISDNSNQINCTKKQPSTEKSKVEVQPDASSGSDSINTNDSGNDVESIQKVVAGPDSESSYTGTVVAVVLVLLIIALIVGGVYFYRKNNGQPKILVRPYVQQWVKYVNDPVQRWRDSRREPLTNHDAYSDVYEAGTSDHTYANPTYEGASHIKKVDEATNTKGEARSFADSGILTLVDNDGTCHDDYDEDIHDGHYVSYSQRDKLLDKEFV